MTRGATPGDGPRLRLGGVRAAGAAVRIHVPQRFLYSRLHHFAAAAPTDATPGRSAAVAARRGPSMLTNFMQVFVCLPLLLVFESLAFVPAIFACEWLWHGYD